MKQFKNFIWVLILIGGILVLVSIFTPVVHHFSSVEPIGFAYHSWMWGLWYIDDLGTLYDGFYFSDIFWGQYGHPLILIYSIRVISTFVILLSSILLIIMANRLRAGRKHIKDLEIKLIIWGAILIIIPILFTISYNLFSTSYYLFLTQLECPGFAFIAPFIGGALSLVGGIYSKYKISEEEK